MLASIAATMIFTLSHALSEAAAEDSAPITETSLVAPETSQVSDRESRLRDIEDELLKQLSMGVTPTAQESTPTPLPNIKHVATSEQVIPEPTPTALPQRAAPPRRAPAPAKTAAPSVTTRPRMVTASLPEPSTVDEVSVPEGRRPQSGTLVPVTTKAVPHRTPKVKRASGSEQLSAKDLEHRLAIAESQVTLLTKELETTKAKLAQSESKALDRTRQGDAGSSDQETQGIGQTSADVQKTAEQGADDTDTIDMPAKFYATVARVTKDNAPLRVGPGARESTILRVPRNSTVKIEHRTGEWYRVITSDGLRGWITGSALIFDVGIRGDSTVRVGAFETRFETMELEY